MQSNVSIVLVNYKSGQFLRNCLLSIMDQNTKVDYEIILVDNSAEDGVCMPLLAEFPAIVYLKMPGNEGFARANNAGIAKAHGKVVLLLNTDTIIHENAIEIAAERLITNTELVACGVQLLFANGTAQTSGSFNLPGGLNFLMTIPYLGQILRWISLSVGVKKPSIQETKTQTEVDWISGAFLMVKKTAIDKAGTLDPDFFLYHEESEWCGRLQRFGKLCLFGDLHVTHLEGASANTAFGSSGNNYSNLSDRKGYQLLLSLLVRLRKQFGVGWFLLHLMVHSVAVPLVLPIGAMHALLSGSQASTVFNKAAGYSLNVIRTWRFLFQIISNKPYFYKVL